MDAMPRELGSLSMVLEFVAEHVRAHGAKLEDQVRVQIMGIVRHWSGFVDRLDASLQKYQHDRIVTDIKW